MRYSPSADETAAVLDALLEHERPYLDPRCSITMLTLATGLSYHHIHRYFQSRGLPFAEYRMKARINEAMRLIEGGAAEKLTLEAIARECGYASRTNFLTHFRRVVGVTPTEYAKLVHPNVGGDSG